MLQYKYPTEFYKRAVDPYISPSHLCAVDDTNSFLCNGSELAHLTYSKREDSQNEAKIGIDSLSVKNFDFNIQSITKISYEPQQEVVVGLVDSNSSVSIYRKYLNEDNYSSEINTNKDDGTDAVNAAKRFKRTKYDSVTTGSSQVKTNFGFADLRMINENICCSMHHYSKSIRWFDIQQDVRETRSIFCYNNPTAICSSHAHGDVAMIAQCGSFAVYDHRQGELDGCCVPLENVSKQSIWSMCCKENEVVLAGADRCVYVYDVRTWKSRLKWRSPCKFDIVKVLPSYLSVDKDFYYIAGHDNEVFLSELSNNNQEKDSKHKNIIETGEQTVSIPNEKEGSENIPVLNRNLKSFTSKALRTDAKWTGLDLVTNNINSNNNEVLVGSCALGNLYVIPTTQNAFKF